MTAEQEITRLKERQVALQQDLDEVLEAMGALRGRTPDCDEQSRAFAEERARLSRREGEILSFLWTCGKRIRYNEKWVREHPPSHEGGGGPEAITDF